jgi:hypothetical protein
MEELPKMPKVAKIAESEGCTDMPALQFSVFGNAGNFGNG